MTPTASSVPVIAIAVLENLEKTIPWNETVGLRHRAGNEILLANNKLNSSSSDLAALLQSVYSTTKECTIESGFNGKIFICEGKSRHGADHIAIRREGNPSTFNTCFLLFNICSNVLNCQVPRATMCMGAWLDPLTFPLSNTTNQAATAVRNSSLLFSSSLCLPSSSCRLGGGLRLAIPQSMSKGNEMCETF